MGYFTELWNCKEILVRVTMQMHEYSDIIVERTDFSFVYWASEVREHR